MKRIKILPSILIVCVIFCLFSCKKFLEAKPDAKLEIASKLDDLQALLDAPANNTSSPALIETAIDNFYLTDLFLNTTLPEFRDSYLWQKNENLLNVEWVAPYLAISYSNIVLEEIDKVKDSKSDIPKYNSIKGNAYFLRAYTLFNLLQVFGKPYNSQTSSTDLGVAIRTTSNVNIESKRNTVEECYQQIISDLKLSANLLTDQALVKTRATKQAALGALAKVYLNMGKYDLAANFADGSLKIYDKLLDYNTLDSNARSPISAFNDEVIYHTRSNTFYPQLQASACIIDTTLYRSYHTDDLRKAMYFTRRAKDVYAFKGWYYGFLSGGRTHVFYGITTDELYLIRAECNARQGNLELALSDLNKLMVNRWKTGKYVNFISSDSKQVLTRILTERRKELLFRGTRWQDLRRLKDDTEYTVTPQRKVNNVVYSLLPNSPRYTFPLPISIISVNGMPQNP